MCNFYVQDEKVIHATALRSRLDKEYNSGQNKRRAHYFSSAPPPDCNSFPGGKKMKYRLPE